MLRSLGLVRAVLQRIRADPLVALASWLLLVSATTLLAAGALYGDTVALGGVRRTIQSAPPAQRAILARTAGTPAEGTALAPVVVGELQRALRTTGGEVVLIARTPGLEWPDAPGQASVLASAERIESHGVLTGGRWAEPGREPVEATISEGTAAATGLGIGDRIPLVGSLAADLAVDVVIVGTWRADPADPYWLDDPLELQGSEVRGATTISGPFVIAAADLTARFEGRRVDHQWRALPDIDGLELAELDGFRADVTALRQRLRAELPPNTDVAVTTALPETLATVDRSVLAARSGVLLLTIQFAVLAGYAILLVAGMLLERRRAETALLRSRGASMGHLTGLALVEAIVLAVPAAVLAPLFATGLVRLLGSLGPLAGSGVVAEATADGATVVAAAVTGLLCIAVLTVPTVFAGGSAGPRAGIGRALGRTLGQRLGIDLALIVLAVIAMWQLRLYGAPLTQTARGTLGIDPLLVAAPAIGLLAGALVATRVMPRMAELAERFVVRRTGLVAPLGTRQVARRPLRYTRSALLLMLAAALGTFAVADAATWSRSQTDRAAFTAAADARALVPGFRSVSDWASGPLYRSVGGVERASPVVRADLQAGRAVRTGQVLALDATRAADIITFAPSPSDPATTSGSIDELVGLLATARPEVPFAPLPGTPRRVALTITADVVAVEGFSAVPPDWTGIRVSLVIVDGDGRVHRLEGGGGNLVDAGQRVEVPLTAALGDLTLTPTYPIAIEAIELSLVGPPETVVYGTVDLGAVEASAFETGDDWAPVRGIADGWSWEASGGGFDGPGPAPVPGSRQIEFGTEDLPVFGSGSAYRYTLSARPPAPLELAAIASSRFLADTGARVGDAVSVRVSGRSAQARIVGLSDLFPPLDPATPYLVVDTLAFDLAAYLESSFTDVADEWWLALDPERRDEVAGVLAAEPFGASIIERVAVERSLAEAPVPLGIVGALALGSIAAVAFAAIGFVSSAAMSTSERSGEFALLRALGLSTRQLSGWLTAENAFLLAFGLVAGTALGALLAWLVLPFATLTETGEAAVPAPQVVMPWEALVPLYVVAAVLLVVTVAVVSRLVPRISLQTVLRARDE